MNENEQRIAATICQLARITELPPEKDVYDAGMSSLQALQLLVEFETQFEVTLPDEDFVKCRTVRAFASLIQTQRAAP